MSHYEIDYAGLDARTLQQKAVADCRAYLGEEFFTKLEAECQASAPIPYRQWEILLEFNLGIEGPPVQMLYNHMWPAAAKPLLSVIEREEKSAGTPSAIPLSV